MITCQDARNLFSRYLEGDLPSSLQTELNAHRLSCSSCQNELTMLETCGDVIALDRREPKLNASFTDRVLAARREQMAEETPRRWNRMILYIGSPLVAAACIAFIVVLYGPWLNKNETTIGGAAIKVPEGTLKYMTDRNNKPIPPEKQVELDALPPMKSTTFSEALMGRLQKTNSDLEDTRQSIKDLELILFLSISDSVLNNEELIKEYQELNQNNDEIGNIPNDNPQDIDPDSPSLPNSDSSAEPNTDIMLDDAL